MADESETVAMRDGTGVYVETYGCRSHPPIFLGPHFYPSRRENDEPFTDTWIKRLKADFFLIMADYPRGIGRSPNPQGLQFGPDIAAQEYCDIADALGVARFGWLGYSFGGAMGVQIACRTNRVSALAVGGFPPMNAPFRQMLGISKRMVENPPPLPAGLRDPGILLSAVGFYSALDTWAERQEVSKLTIPRLTFMGDEDAAQGSTEPVPLADSLRSAEDELRNLGWTIHWLQGHDHITALRPDVSLPAVHQFFSETMLRR